MNHMAPIGPVYQAGTLSGNPVAVAAGLTTLKLIQAPGFYETLSAQTEKLVDGLSRRSAEAGVEFCADSVGGMFGMYFAPRQPASLCGDDGGRQGALQQLLPRHAGRRRVLRAVDVRGRLRLDPRTTTR